MKKGVICGNFDVMHPGYIKMFKECADNCDCLVVMLHSDPSIERPQKIKPIRFLGDDYKNKPFTGDDLKIPIYYLDRSHGWSTTKFKKLISKTV